MFKAMKPASLPDPWRKEEVQGRYQEGEHHCRLIARLSLGRCRQSQALSKQYPLYLFSSSMLGIHQDKSCRLLERSAKSLKKQSICCHVERNAGCFLIYLVEWQLLGICELCMTTRSRGWEPDTLARSLFWRWHGCLRPLSGNNFEELPEHCQACSGAAFLLQGILITQWSGSRGDRASLGDISGLPGVKWPRCSSCL